MEKNIDDNDEKVYNRLMELNETVQYIKKQVGKEFVINMIHPNQITDGCIVEFADGEAKKLVANARLRFRNRLHHDSKNGTLRLEINFSDVMFHKNE